MFRTELDLFEQMSGWVSNGNTKVKKETLRKEKALKLKCLLLFL